MTPLTFLYLAAGLVLLMVGAELLVRGAAALALTMRISPLIVGLTVVAFGTSAPELAVSVKASYTGHGDLAVGNVVGSNICNVLLILGLSAAITPLAVSAQVVRRETPLVIGVSILLLVLGLDGSIGRLDGLLLAGGLVVYTVWTIIAGRRETRAADPANAGATSPDTSGTRALLTQVVLIVVGLALLLLGSDWMVDSAVAIATALEISQLVIGLTIIAIGTSLPELATSAMAALRGQRDIAVGNVIGSNIFNILSVLGLSALAAPMGIAVSPAALSFDIPVMIAVAVACLPIFFTGHLIARWEGLLFLAYYAAYIAYLTLDAAGHDALSTVRATLAYVVPLTFVTLAVLAARAMHRR